MTLNYISSQNRVNTFQQKVCCRPGYSSRTVSFCVVTWGSRVSLVFFPPSQHSSPTNPLDKRVDRSKRSITAAVTFCGLKVTSVSSAYSPLSTQILVIWTTAVTYFAHSLHFEQDPKGMTPLFSMQCQSKLENAPPKLKKKIRQLKGDDITAKIYIAKVNSYTVKWTQLKDETANLSWM